MLPGRTYTLDDVVRLARRRRWLLLLPLTVGLVAGVAAYAWLPARYRSETLIMVVPQRIPNDFVKSTVTMSVTDRLRSISEEILSRSRLERIILDLTPYGDESRTGLMEDVVKRMRGDIDVAVEGVDSSFRLAYSNRDPDVAQSVAARLADLYIQENIKDREELADSTSQFLQSQLEEAKQRLVAQEQTLEAYKRRHAGQLPSQLEGNLHALQSTQMQLQSLNETMNRARERRLLVERQIADTRAFPDTAAPGAATPSTSAPVSLHDQLAAARARLDASRQKYTEDHPDTLGLRDTIRGLEARIASGRGTPAGPAETALSPADAARRKRILDLEAELAVIDRQLATAQQDEARLGAMIANYRTKIDVVPKRESELVELTRDYSTLQTSYASLLRKREESEVAANLERRQIGEQFKVLDPASRPERPYNQKVRQGALVGGALGGLVVGVLLVGFLEYRDLTFRDEGDVRRVLSLPVLALVPGLDAPEPSAPVAATRPRKVPEARWR